MADTAHLVVYHAIGGDGPDRFRDIGNDPDFRDPPITWGICRSNVRRRRKIGDHLFFIAYLGAGLQLESRYYLAAYLRVGGVVDQTTAAGRFAGRENVILEPLPMDGSAADSVVLYIRRHRLALAWPETKDILSDLDADPKLLRKRADDYVVTLEDHLFIHSWWDPHADWRRRLEAPYIVGGSESRIIPAPVPYRQVHEVAPGLPTAGQLRTKVGYMYWHIPKPVEPDSVETLLSVVNAASDTGVSWPEPIKPRDPSLPSQ